MKKELLEKLEWMTERHITREYRTHVIGENEARQIKDAILNQATANGVFLEAAKKVMLENARLRDALDFYARREHWMEVSEGSDFRTLLVAHSHLSNSIHGFGVAEDTLAVNNERLRLAMLIPKEYGELDFEDQ